MYNLVLMAALTTGGETPNWGFRGHGCHGCYGAHACRGCRGGYGGCHGCYGGMSMAGYGCYGGCYGCMGYYSQFYGMHPYPVVHPMPYVAPEPLPQPKKLEDKKSSSLNRAKMVVELPADAKLYIDDQLMKATSERRSFTTPDLVRGQAYYYILRAETVRDGKTLMASKRVIVRAGETVQTSLQELTPVETARAELSVRR